MEKEIERKSIIIRVLVLFITQVCFRFYLNVTPLDAYIEGNRETKKEKEE